MKIKYITLVNSTIGTAARNMRLYLQKMNAKQIGIQIHVNNAYFQVPKKRGGPNEQGVGKKSEI